MRIPTRGLPQFCYDLIQQCTDSRDQRVESGTAYRNLFYAGSENGVPQTFLRTQDYILDLLGILFSPSELRFAIDYYGASSAAERAIAKASASVLHDHIADGDVDTTYRDATLWALIKGKTIIHHGFSRSGLEATVVQPELFGVLREDLADLKSQEAFVHTTFMTRSRFAQMISGLTSAEQTRIIKGVRAFQKHETAPDQSGTSGALRQVFLGAMQPYTTQGQAPVAGGGTVNWLGAQYPQLHARVAADLVQYDQLWVWDTANDDWATFTMVGDVPVFGGKEAIFNAFADYSPRANSRPDENPLRGRHPYTEMCANRTDSYFWGRSSVADVALLQRSLNNRVDGINQMLRKQEDPPRWGRMMQGVNQNAYAKLNRPGGWATDGNPQAEIKELVQAIPTDVWRSLAEINQMFDTIAGQPPVIRGEGEGSVRSQGHAETLLRTGGARHKDPALLIERCVDMSGTLCLAMLKARNPDLHYAWAMPGTQSSLIQPEAERNPAIEPPARGMLPIVFRLGDLRSDVRVRVDAHSASPAFSFESRQLAFALNKIGAASPQRVVELTHPPQEDALVADAEEKAIQQAELLAQHPELAMQRPPGRPRTH